MIRSKGKGKKLFSQRNDNQTLPCQFTSTPGIETLLIDISSPAIATKALTFRVVNTNTSMPTKQVNGRKNDWPWPGPSQVGDCVQKCKISPPHGTIGYLSEKRALTDKH